MIREPNRREFLSFAGTGVALACVPQWSVAAHRVDAIPSAAGSGVDTLTLVPAELKGPLEQLLKNMPDVKFDAAGLAKARAMHFADVPGPTREPVWKRRLISGPKGAPQVAVYLINAANPGARKPAILHIHGGGYIFGNAESSVAILQSVARELDCVVVTVDYRLAPETPFPGSLEDNYAALGWLHHSAEQLGVDPHRIAVMGESAGGGHAAMLALTARDRGEYPLAAQVLIYPMLDDRTGSTRAVPAHIGQYVWTRDANRFGWSSLLGRPAGSENVPAGSVPARVANLSGLPPTFIGVGSIDLFVEEDVEYARSLLVAGVPVELLVVPGAYHGFDLIASQATLSSRFRAAWIGALRRAFS